MPNMMRGTAVTLFIILIFHDDIFLVEKYNQ